MASTSAPIGGRAATGQGLFTRQSSGLVRELGVPAATGIALASVAVVNTFINFNAGLVSFDKAEMTLPLLLGAAIWLAVAAEGALMQMMLGNGFGARGPVASSRGGSGASRVGLGR